MLNKTQIIGHVGKDPEIKEFKDGGKIATFSVATTERGFKTKDGREIPDRTEWHNIVVQGGLVKVVENYVTKGKQLYIEGRLKTRSWENKEGEKRYRTEIVCTNLLLLSKGEVKQAKKSEPDTDPGKDENGDDLPF